MIHKVYNYNIVKNSIKFLKILIQIGDLYTGFKMKKILRYKKMIQFNGGLKKLIRYLKQKIKLFYQI